MVVPAGSSRSFRPSFLFRATRSRRGSCRNSLNTATACIRRSDMANGRAVSRINWPGLAVLALVLLAWEAVVRAGVVVFEFFPAPSAILAGGVELARDGILLQDLLHTLLSIAIGWVVALAIGIFVGLLLWFFSPGL